MTANFKKGDKVYRYYTAEPAFLFGHGQQRENGVVIGDPIVWDGRHWIPVKWEFSPYHPSLDTASRVYLQEQA